MIVFAAGTYSHRHGIGLFLTLFILGLLSSCLKSPSAPPTQEPTTITLSTYRVVFTAVNERLRVDATVLDQDSRVITDATVNWRSANRDVASVTDRGVVTATGSGTTQIIVTSGYATASVSVSVEQAADRIEIKPSSITLRRVGQTGQFTAVVYDAGNRIIPGAVVVWTSSDPAVATVDANGQVTAVSLGSSQVTASSGGVSTSRPVYVEIEQAPSRIVLNISEATLSAVGQSLQLDAQVYDADGAAIPVAVVTWSSNRPDVATVDGNGLMIAVSNGTTRVTATSGDASAHALIHVVIEDTEPPEPPEPPPEPPEPPVAARITIVPETATLTALGLTIRLEAEVYDSDGSVIPDAPVSWSSSDPDIATVDADGLVTAISDGIVQITARSEDATASATVIVEDRANHDREALVALYNSADGPNWTNNTNWLTAMPVKSWYGVEPRFTERVIGLKLESNQLKGAIPPEIGLLSAVKDIWFFRNQLSGKVPSEISMLSNLEQLLLQHNELTAIPDEIGQLANLRKLDLSSNRLTTFPAGILELRSLRDLYLSSNPLNEEIPAGIARLGNLQTLNMSNNQFTGEIPSGIGQMSALRALILQTNQLTGTIPPGIGQLVNLQTLWLNLNQLTGAIPPEIGRMKSLQSLLLLGNQLSGSIPPEIGKLDRLVGLIAHDNDLTGEIPVEVGQMESLEQLDLATNRLTGEIPVEVGQLRKLRFLELYGNDLTGGIPPQIGQLTNLTKLRLNDNRLSGAIPSEIGNLSGLQALHLGGNAELAGPLPRSMTNLNLESLTLYDTQLCVPATDEFRAWLAGIEETNGVTFCEAAPEPSSDRDVLEAFYHATGGPDWTNNTNWLSEKPLGEWFGVTTDNGIKVIELDLLNNNLTGTLPSEIGQLPNIRGLDLTENRITGPIPPEIGQLRSLQDLIMLNNQLTGEIPPEIGQLGNLATLHLDNNQLSGSIPPEIGNMNSLQFMSLSVNRLTGGIPPELGNLKMLNYLSVSSNRLSGGIPHEFWNMKLLRTILLSNNEFTGEIPSEIGDLTALNWVWLNENLFTGEIPPEIGNLNALRSLNLSENRFSGGVPPDFGRMARLEGLWLNTNKDLVGPLPVQMTSITTLRELWLEGTGLCVPSDDTFRAWLAGIEETNGITFCEDAPETSSDRDALEAFYHATDGPNWKDNTNWLSDAPLSEWYGLNTDRDGRVAWLELEDNGLEGPLPPVLGRLDRLQSLNLLDNKLTGPVPKEIGTLRNLIYLDLGENDLTGPIPAELGQLGELQGLYLLKSGLTGSIPPEIGNLRNLVHLIFYGNQLSGQIPPEIGMLSNLQVLDLSRNSLSGPIPPEIGQLSAIQVLSIHESGLSGPIPPEIGQLNVLIKLSLQNNELTGAIPPEIGNLNRLEDLILSNNELEGAIPPEIGNLNNLRALTLGSNPLTGTIPPEFGRLTRLKRLSLQYNSRQSGPIPRELIRIPLEGLFLIGTPLCVPPEDAFRTWLDNIEQKNGITFCEE